MSKFHLITLLCLLFIACDDQKQVHENSNRYTVKELILNQVCKANCGETSSCEGDQIKLCGTLRKPTVEVPWIHLEEIDNDITYTIELKLIDPNEAFLEYLLTLYDQAVEVTGELMGEDRAIRSQCLHLFYLDLKDEDQIELK